MTFLRLGGLVSDKSSSVVPKESILDANPGLTVGRSILDCIGRTPMVGLVRFTRGLSAEILVKLEWFSPS